jgi:ABC-type transport system substrate-binding protein
VTWKLKNGVTWHDGKPFTADDCLVTWEFAADPATASVSIGTYKDVKVDKVDSHTIRVTFQKPTPFWADAFCGERGMVIPKHLFEAFKGAKSREAPNNLKPVGTGPYRFVDFKPGDVVRGELNPGYHMPNRPHFDTIEMKGGGDAVSAARAVIQTGEFDYAWNMQVEDEILKRLEQGGRGKGGRGSQAAALEPHEHVRRHGAVLRRLAHGDACRELRSDRLGGSTHRVRHRHGGARLCHSPPRQIRAPGRRERRADRCRAGQFRGRRRACPL